MEAPTRTRAHVPHPLRPYEPLIINAALTGMVPRRSQVPAVPVTATQIVESAVACVDAGAAILHLHARDADEAPEWRREAYEEFIPAIREACPDTVICVTTSGRDVGSSTAAPTCWTSRAPPGRTWRASPSAP